MVEVQDLIFNFYTKLYAVEGDSVGVSMTSFFPLISSSIIDQDVKYALFDMSHHKAPGVDGIPASFYQKGWNIMGQDLIKFVQHAFVSGMIPNTLNTTSMVLIPKVSQLKRASQFRPINLCSIL